MTEVLDHIRRVGLPWRDDGLTECGRDASQYPTLTLDEAIAKIKRQGQQRSAMTTCMTCWNQAGVYATLHHRGSVDEVLGPIEREIRRVEHGHEDRDRLVREFAAIGMLIVEHRAEFDGLVAALQDTTDLAAARASRQHRR